MKNKKLYVKQCSYCGKEIRFYHGEKTEECPFCEQTDYIKTPTETKLFLIQKEYFIKRNPEVLNQMYPLLVSYAESLVKKILPDTFSCRSDYIHEKAIDASTLLIEQLLTRKSFSIEKSFAGYLRPKIKQVLWNNKDKKEDQHESLNTIVNNDNNVELQDLIEINNIDPFLLHEDNFDTFYKEDMIQTVLKLITSIIDTVKKNYSTYDVFLLLISLKVYFQEKTKKNIDEFISDYSLTLKGLFKKAIYAIEDYFKSELNYGKN